MKIFLKITLVSIFLSGCSAVKSPIAIESVPVSVEMDLVALQSDMVKVIVDPGAFNKDNVLFMIPKTVPGTYSTDNYGKYLQDFKALDYDGRELAIERLDDNTWQISNGKTLDKVSYWVNDTYDTEKEMEEAVFSPAGTNIEAGKNFVLNLHGFVGYFDGYEELSYQLKIRKPINLQSSTSLTKINTNSNPNEDMFVASRYFEVIDSPILYAEPNIETFQINTIQVTLSLYSPNNVYKASDLKDKMVKMMAAQKAFLGEVDSTKEYNILLYLSDIEKKDAQGYGALEHHTSTVVVLPEVMPIERLEQAMVDVVSHEFFHIVTPLSVHSKEIQYFDFNNPKMSQHLWMYEGTTEYFANLFQMQQGLINESEFYDRLRGKIENAKAFDDSMSFTIMSKNILVYPYKDNYANVYEKGTLINMCLDIILREKSGGEKGVLWLLKELSKKYGKDTPFNDDELFNEITALTYPEIGAFFKTNVIGDTPINYAEFLDRVGLVITEVKEQTGYFLDGQMPYVDVNIQTDSTIFIREGIQLNSFFNDLELQGGDILKKFNDTEITLETLRPIIMESFNWTSDTMIRFEVVRDGETILIEGTAGTPTVSTEKIVPLEDASEEKVSLREAWLKH